MAPKQATRRLAALSLLGSLVTSGLFILQDSLVGHGSTNSGKPDGAVAASLSAFRESHAPLKQKPATVGEHISWNDTQYPAATDSLCGGCRHAIADEEKNRCGFWILDFQAKFQLNPIQAAEKVAQQFPNTCGICQPQSCSVKSKIYWRYDRVGPRIDHAQTLQLTSIPSIHRLTPQAVSNVTDYFSVPEHVYPQVEYLFEYNPSLVRLPMSQRPILVEESPVYLASFRVSNQHYCFAPSDRKLLMGGQKAPMKDWLGLALLRQDLTVIQDVVVDLKKAHFASAQDFRLFVLHDQLYISSYDILAPLWLIPPLGATNTMILPIVFGDLEIAVRDFVSCAPCNKKNHRGYCGKNMNYFVDANQESVVEIWPSPPHLVRTLNTDAQCLRNETPDSRVDGSQPPVHPSFASIEELHFPGFSRWESLLTRGRGGACCVSLSHPATGETLLVGIQHSKTIHQGPKRLPGNVEPNHYLSSVYAFEPKPPYRIVAQSGYFCLGFPSQPEQDANPLVRATTWRKLVLGEEFDCPRISFVSGMTLKEDDPFTVIIAYGINDCVSRMIEVPMSDLERLLFANFTVGADGMLTKL